MAPSFSRVSSGALLLVLAYNARPVEADFWEDVDNCELVINDIPANLTTDFCNDWTNGYQAEDGYVTVTGPAVTVTEYPAAETCDGEGYSTTTEYPKPTEAPDYGTTPAPEATGGYETGDYDVTVTSTTTTTFWTASTIYPEYPAATPTPAYRRHARDLPLNQRASWCDDRPCRLVQYDDDTIFEACKKYLGWASSASTVSVPGYTVTITSYPTDCKKKDDSYKPEPVPTETHEPYPTEYPGNEYKPWDDTNTDDSQQSDDLQPWENAFDTNYDGPDSPKPWDDVDATSELADAIDASGYDDATAELGLDDAPWNALPVDFQNSGAKKRDYPVVEAEGYGYDGEDVPEVAPEPEESYEPEPEPEPSQPEDTTDSYPATSAPNLYGPDVPSPSESPSDSTDGYPDGSWSSHDDSPDDGTVWVLPDSSEYEGDGFESDYYSEGDAPYADADADVPSYVQS
ncbi:hypothetical protein G6514_004041 [Epicoccum nigrum]|nr:hypothetical protein G6514_004041 [Epicoccum nigrum]